MSNRCDQCEAVMINGVYCHETGCPNSPTGQCHQCRGMITKSGGTWTNKDSEWTGLTFCSSVCAADDICDNA